MNGSHYTTIKLKWLKEKSVKNPTKYTFITKMAFVTKLIFFIHIQEDIVTEKCKWLCYKTFYPIK